MLNLRQLAKDRWLKQQDIAEILNVAQSKVSLLMNNPKTIKPDLLAKLTEYFGEDVIKAYTMPDTAHIPQTQEATVSIIKADIIEEAKQLGRDEVRDSDVIEVDAEDIKKFSLPFVTNDIAQSPNVDIKALVTANSPKLGRYPIGQKLSGVSYAQRIITEAMTGANFFPGDVIFLTYLDKTQLISDSAYLLDTRDYGTLFRLVTIEKDGLLLRPCSDDKDRFKPIFLREDEILSYAALVMQIRTSFSFSNGIHLAEMVKNRDEQIKRMVDAQQQMLDELCRQNERLDEERAWSKELTQKAFNNK